MIKEQNQKFAARSEDWFRKKSIMQKIFLGYLSTILIGTLLLWLPISSSSGSSVKLSDAFFTSTSAACVTGLIRFDTYSSWSLFGQIVLLLLIQVGGMGFMTIAIMIMTMSGAKIGLNSRVMMQNAISAPQMGGIVRITRFVVRGTAIVEGAGAVLLAFFFVPKLGFLKGIWFSVFHSVSAFCNAGFDLMGYYNPGSSLTGEAGNWYLNMIIMLLIILGGLGFFVWMDLLDKKFRFSMLKLQTKVVLAMTGFLLVSGTLAILFLENGGEAFASMNPGERILVSMFQSVTSRTAGFNTVDLSKLTSASQIVMIGLMLVGGSPGSTAGGMKTTTAAVQLLTIRSVFRGRKQLEIFGRSIEDSVVRTASCVTSLYMLLSVVSALLIAHIENVPVLTALFETVSAVATVGVTLGITSGVCLVSKMILAALMIFGRTGSLTILLALSANIKKMNARYPVEKLQVG